jgi:hypothetical protein
MDPYIVDSATHAAYKYRTHDIGTLLKTC